MEKIKGWNMIKNSLPRTTLLSLFSINIWQSAPKFYYLILIRLMCKLKFTPVLKVYCVHKSSGSHLSHPFNPCDIKQCVTI